MTDTAFEIAYLTADRDKERLTSDRDKERRAAEAWARAAENERMSTRVAIRQRDEARAAAAARATEQARAIVAGIAGAMGLDTSGDGDEIHARILAEHARLTREREAARAALCDASRCEECGAWATRYHSGSARYACDSCGRVDGWVDDVHAPALRAARVP